MSERRPVPIRDIVFSWYFALALSIGVSTLALVGNGLAWANCAWAGRNSEHPTRFIPFRGCFEEFDGHWVRKGDLR